MELLLPVLVALVIWPVSFIGRQAKWRKVSTALLVAIACLFVIWGVRSDGASSVYVYLLFALIALAAAWRRYQRPEA